MEDIGDIRSNNRRPELMHDVRERKRNRLRAMSQRNDRSAAITLQRDGEDNYNEIILKAKREISLTEIGINDCKIRRGYTGGLVIEIPGEGASMKADILADKLKQVLSNEEVSIRRP